MKNKILLLYAVPFLFSTTLNSATPVQTHGAMVVSGNKIVGAIDSKPVQAAGMSYYWSIWGGEKFYNRQVVDWLVKDWNITLIRAAMGIEHGKGYLEDSQNQKKLVKAVVDAAIENGIYVIVDWHDHNGSQHVNEAKDFFKEMAKTYKNTPNLIWEIWNEPDDKSGTGTNGFDTWDDIKKYANQVIPAIREYSSNLIVVGTPNWSQDVDVAAGSPLSGPNIAYTLHFYAGTHKGELRSKAEKALDKGIALFITEFGLSTADGGNKDKSIFTSETKTWLDWADQKGISWANWSIIDHTESSAALKPGASTSGNWSSDKLSESGTWVRDRLKKRPVDISDQHIDTLAVPGKVEAEKFSSKSTELQTETTTDEGSGKNLGFSKSGSWAEYVIKTSQAGSYVAQIRIASESEGGKLTLKLNGNSVASWDISKTGGWHSWKTTNISNVFQLSNGISKARIEWSGSANLNWIQFDKSTSTQDMLSKTPSISVEPLVSRPGFVSFYVSSEVKTITVFTLRGVVLQALQVNAGSMELPLCKGLHLLRIENRAGEKHSIPVMGF